MVVFRRLSDGAPWEDVGDVCVGESHRPVTVAEAAARVRDRFVDLLPRPAPSYQPPNGALVNLPAVFASGQRDGVMRDDFTLFDLDVRVDAHPSWTWEFGDGTTLRTESAGGRYPDTSVSHTYREAGRLRVSVAASWTGTFTIDGLGPFAVEGGPVTQESGLWLDVREAGGRLVVS